MLGVTSRVRVCSGDGDLLPCAGLPGLLTTPVPRDELLTEFLAAVPPADLPRLLERIAFHRIDGLAHRAISRLDASAVPAWLRASLRRRAQRFASATLSQTMTLAEALQAFDRAGIAVAVMRGLRTVESVYEDPSLHPFEDHDLLVLAHERDLARSVLRRLGYVEEAWGLFRRGGAIVDLHVDPLGAHRRPSRQAVFPIEAETLFRRGAMGTVAGGPSFLLQPEDELLLLAIHLVKHSFDRLLRIADVAHFVFRRRSILDWDLLSHRARSCGASRLLAWALRSTALLGVAVRAEDLPPGRPDGSLARFLMGRVLDLRPPLFTGEALMMLAAGTLPARIRFLLDALWPRGERPAGLWSRASAVPRRVLDLATGAALQAVERRRM